MTSRCIEGQYFRLTEVSFSSTDDMNTALETDLGKEIMAGAGSVAEKYGVQLEVLVVADATYVRIGGPEQIPCSRADGYHR